MALDGVNGANGARRVNSSGLYQVGETQKQKQSASIWIESHGESFPATPKQKMSRSTAKAWVKEYQESNNCSKKEAKAAFQAQFGYEVPAGFFKKALNFISTIGKRMPTKIDKVIAESKPSVITGKEKELAQSEILKSSNEGVID